jgi:uncharacterized protein with von Willebrand factor type A (vWA) domain
VVLHRRIGSIQDFLDNFRRSGVTQSELSPSFGAGEERLRERSDRLLRQPSIDSFVHEFPDEATAVKSEVIRSLRTAALTTAKTTSTDRDDDRRLLEAFRAEDAQSQVGRWTRRNRYRTHLANTYQRSEVSLESYDEESRGLRAHGNDRQAAEGFTRRIADDWEAALEKKQPGSGSDLEEQDRRILKSMEHRIARFRSLAELLGPIRRYLAPSWDLAGSIQHESVFDLFQRSERILEQKKHIQAIADRLGRLDQAELEHSNATLRHFSKQETWITNRAAKSTVVGVRESDDISAIISSEAVLLSSEQTEDLFYLKFAEKKLVTYDYQPEARSRATPLTGKARDKVRVKRRGPIILAVDTSASMTGEWEQDAKALALAIVRIAFRRQRAVHVISFSEVTASIVLSPAREGSLSQLIKFLLMSFHGGTDLGEALTAGLAKLQDQEFRKADMIFLTDGDADVFRREQVRAMNAARHEGVRFYGLLVGDTANEHLLAQFDFNWRYHKARLSEVAVNLERFRRDLLELGEQQSRGH